MKPNFALNLTHEAIVLLHRTARGWLTIGEAALDRADLTEALGYLRASALGLAPQGMTTKLVIPNSQILYTEVDAPSLDPERRMAQVRTALDGLTPYAVDDLVFDVCGSGPRVQVAVVARETLVEAESFAVQHRMNPLSCVAIPPEGAFGAEPFFGPTDHASRVLASGDSVERDAEPVSIVTREDSAARGSANEGQPRAARRQRAAAAAPPVAAATAEAPSPAAPPEVAATAAAAAVADAEDLPDSAPEAPLVLQDETGTGAPADMPGAASPDAEGTAPVVNAPPSAREDDEAAAPRASTPSLPEVLAAAAPQMAVSAPMQRGGAALAETTDKGTADPAAVPVAPTQSSAAQSSAAQSSAVQPSPVAASPVAASPVAASPVAASPTQSSPVPATTGPGRQMDGTAAAEPADGPIADHPPAAEGDIPPPPAFSSRRKEVAGKAAPTLPVEPRVIEAETAPVSRTPPVAPPVAASADPLPEAKSAVRRDAPPLTVVASVPGLAGIKAAAGGAAQMRGMPPSVEGPPPLRSMPRPTLAAVGAPAASAPPAPAKPPARGRVSGKPTAPRGGALGAKAPRGKPRFLGLILTGLLLVVLVGFAAWSSRFLSDNSSEVQPATQVATAGSALPEAPAPVELTTDALPGEGATAGIVDDPEYLADLAAVGAAPEEAAPDAAALLPDAEDVEPAPVASAADAITSEPAATPEPAPAPAVALAEPEAVPAPETTTQASPAPAPVAEVPPPAPATATAGLGSAAPLAATTAPQDEIFLAGTDAPPPAFDPAALPPPGSVAEAPPAAALPPPPAGTLYQFDTEGRILASPAGVLMPGGFWMIEARPPVLPPARPAEVAPVAADLQAAAVAAGEPAVQATPDPAPVPEERAVGTVPTDPAIATARPRSRPAGLVAPAAPGAQADDGAALVPPVDADFASVRPRARAGAPLTLAATARLDSGGASLVQTAAAAAAAADDAPVSDVAMALSPRPAPRPVALSRAVEAAVAEASLVPEPRVEPVAPPAEEPLAEPEADAEPEVASAAPRIPTRASVAKQATYANAINLSKVNLIGIFGTPSDRYAMVRTSAGRMSRVKVGDRVDGGTVAAITASELRYQKGGKLLTLSMPRG